MGHLMDCLPDDPQGAALPSRHRGPGASASRRDRPAAVLLVLACAGLLLAGCANTPAAAQLYQLRSTAPEALAPLDDTASGTWQIIGPVQIPEYLDRSSIVVPTGSAGLSPLAGHRWAEPLKDAIPRILRQDLSALLGAQHVWAAPVPPGVVITRQLRLELLRFEASADRRQVRLQARWSLADPAGKSPPAAGQADLSVPSHSTEVDALVAAHRQALLLLARQIVSSAS
jgi:uncharacterized lipoprotein YmbA